MGVYNNACEYGEMRIERPTSGACKYMMYYKKEYCVKQCEKGRITKNNELKGAEVTPSKFL